MRESYRRWLETARGAVRQLEGEVFTEDAVDASLLFLESVEQQIEKVEQEKKLLGRKVDLVIVDDVRFFEHHVTPVEQHHRYACCELDTERVAARFNREVELAAIERAAEDVQKALNELRACVQMPLLAIATLPLPKVFAAAGTRGPVKQPKPAYFGTAKQRKRW